MFTEHQVWKKVQLGAAHPSPCYHPHFTEWEIDIQRGKVTYPKAHG